MAQDEKRKIKMEQLVDELMKDQPRRSTVKQLTSELGLTYSVDPMVQMSTVLQSMNAVFRPSNKKKDLEG